MKANELMIGDKVRQKDSGLLLEISAINPPYIMAFGEDGQFHEDTIEPIPITDEILKKNGFHWTGSGDYTGMRENPKEEIKGVRFLNYIGLKYKTIHVYAALPELKKEDWRKNNRVELEVCGPFVHEFQHALTICGIEKEINL